LNLQISLLSEHEVTRVVTIVAGIARKLELPEADDPELEELAQDVRPEHVIDAMHAPDRVGTSLNDHSPEAR
jgi:hypothetical protein